MQGALCSPTVMGRRELTPAWGQSHSAAGWPISRPALVLILFGALIWGLCSAHQDHSLCRTLHLQGLGSTGSVAVQGAHYSPVLVPAGSAGGLYSTLPRLQPSLYLASAGRVSPALQKHRETSATQLSGSCSLNPMMTGLQRTPCTTSGW